MSNKNIDEEAIDKSLVGREVRALRKNRGWTLASLAQKSGSSIGYLSEVERGERAVSIKSLRGLASAFDVPLGWFFIHKDQPTQERGLVVRAAHRKRIGSPEDGLFEELLSPDISGAFEMFLTRIAPGVKSSDLIDRSVEEQGYLLSGQLELNYGSQTVLLGKGDCFRIDKKPFSWINNGDTETQIIWVTSPAVY